jgi:hypothetical protein
MMPAVVMDPQTRAAHSASEPGLECSRRVIARPTGGQRQPFIVNNGKCYLCVLGFIDVFNPSFVPGKAINT